MDNKTTNNRISDPILESWTKEMTSLRQTIIEDRKNHNENISELMRIFSTAFDKITKLEEKIESQTGFYHTLNSRVIIHSERIKTLFYFFAPTTALSLISTVLLIIKIIMMVK